MLEKLLVKGSNLLSDELALFFGRECLCVYLWMFCILLIRWICYWTMLDRILPCGVIFASPFIIEILKVSYIINLYCIIIITMAAGILYHIIYRVI